MAWRPGWPELVLILLIAIIIFGPGKIPELARALGQAVREFRKESQGIVRALEKPDEVDEETLLKLAEKLDVKTKGKSREEMVKEIVEKAKEKGLLE